MLHLFNYYAIFLYINYTKSGEGSRRVPLMGTEEVKLSGKRTAIGRASGEIPLNRNAEGESCFLTVKLSGKKDRGTYQRIHSFSVFKILLY